MQANRSRDTKPDLAVRSAVHRRGLRYRVAARPQPELRRTADMVFRRAKVAVFVDGCYWHGCPEHHTQPATNREIVDLALREKIISPHAPPPLAQGSLFGFVNSPTRPE